jgi:hypothetical protein
VSLKNGLVKNFDTSLNNELRVDRDLGLGAGLESEGATSVASWIIWIWIIWIWIIWIWIIWIWIIWIWIIYIWITDDADLSPLSFCTFCVIHFS